MCTHTCTHPLKCQWVLLCYRPNVWLEGFSGIVPHLKPGSCILFDQAGQSLCVGCVGGVRSVFSRLSAAAECEVLFGAALKPTCLNIDTVIETKRLNDWKESGSRTPQHWSSPISWFHVNITTHREEGALTRILLNDKWIIIARVCCVRQKIVVCWNKNTF